MATAKGKAIVSTTDPALVEEPTVVIPQSTKPGEFARNVFLTSKKYKHIQQDFLSAILVKPFYTEEEAKKAINKAMGCDMFVQERSNK